METQLTHQAEGTLAPSASTGVDLTGARVLAMAILRQAARDARSGNGRRANALDFLRSDGCRDMLEDVAASLGIDGDASVALDRFLQLEGLSTGVLSGGL